jgi:hypothetical protein
MLRTLLAAGFDFWRLGHLPMTLSPFGQRSAAYQNSLAGFFTIAGLPPYPLILSTLRLSQKLQAAKAFGRMPPAAGGSRRRRTAAEMAEKLIKIIDNKNCQWSNNDIDVGSRSH